MTSPTQSINPIFKHLLSIILIFKIVDNSCISKITSKYITFTHRAAAMRCRQKKKVWVENLEKKAKELEQTNNQLQNEVNYLRNEVHQLKTILLAHKDCPLIISQQQQIARVIQQLGSGGFSHRQ